MIPMPFYINEKLYLEGITLSQEEFYERLKNEESISTSQPGPADVCGLWNTLLESYDQIVHIPMSSGLSASCDTASGLAREYDGKVQVVDNQRISVTQKQSVLDALTLRDAGRDALQIRQVLERKKSEFQYLYYFGNFEISEKGRQDHSCSGSNRNGFESKAGIADPG